MKAFKTLIAATLLAAGTLQVVAEGQDPIWIAVHENPYREAADAARDMARHPEDLMRFLDLEPDMAVAEVNPGGGWYSRILAPFLKDEGKYVGLEHHPDQYAASPGYAANLRAYPARLDARRDMYGPNAVGTWIPATDGLLVEAGSLDAVLVVRAMHNWQRGGFLDVGLDQVHAVLKEGGVLAVVQHRANEDDSRDRDTLAGTGRWKQSDLVAAIEAHGFKLVAASEMNANPKDTKDYPKGVWTLPPSYAMGDVDRATYTAIGESDRMTLKFVKVSG